MDQLNVGIVGAGWVAAVHGNCYRDSAGVQITAVTDPVRAKAARLAAQTGARVVPDVNALIASGVDIVDVCTPPQAHADVTIQALEAGLHVMCEKPLARTLDDARRIVKAAESAAGLLMVGQVSRYEPDHAAAKALVDQGQIGRLRMVTHSTATSLPGWSEAGWLADATKSGGPLIDQAVHSFDYFGWLTGSPAVRVTAMAADSAAGPATYCLATVRYADDTIAQAEVSWAHPPTRGFKLAAELVGTEGRLTWDYDHLMGGVVHSRAGEPEWFDVLGDRGFTAELRAFTDAIRAGDPSPVPAEQALESLRVALGALESVRTGQTIDLTTWETA